jgi:hypothetical protein
MVVVGAASGFRRLRRRESRTEIDIEHELLAKYPNRRVALDDEAQAVDLAAAEAREVGSEPMDAGPTWSAANEAGIVVLPADLDAPEVGATEVEVRDAEAREMAFVGSPTSEPDASSRRRDRRPRVVATGFPPAPRGWDPSQPLPGEPDEAPRLGGRSRGGVAARLSVRVGNTTEAVVPTAATIPDAFETLRRQRDHIARQVAAAYGEVHAVRTDALRRASQAEQHAELAATARARAGRLVREGRRLSAVGRRVGAEVAAPHDSFHKVHELRVESLKRAAEAEHGAERVAMLREKAARLLAEQRRLEAEMTKQLAQRLR